MARMARGTFLAVWIHMETSIRMHPKSGMSVISALALVLALALPMGCQFLKDSESTTPSGDGGPAPAGEVAGQPAPKPAPLPPAKPHPVQPGERERLLAVEDVGREMLWDSFESYNRWVVEAADDPAKLSINKDPQRVSAGLQSLRCEFTAFRKQRSHLRREVFLDLSQMSRMLLDVYAEVDGLALSVAFRVTAWQKFYQTYPIPLKKGWNKGIEIDLESSEFNMAERGAPQLSMLENRDDVRRFSLVIHHPADSKGVVFVDNIRWRGWPDGEWERRDPRIVSITANSSVVRKFEKLELEVELDATYGSYFDPGELDISASFLSPDGTRLTARGYLDDYLDPDGELGTAKWLIRFAPGDVGRWEYNVLVKTRHGEALSATRVFHCREATAGQRGFVRRSKTDGRYFEFDNGEFFYPIGQNVCWATDYEPYFKEMAANGENFARIWMCPWHLPLELRDEVGKYSLDSAKGMDRLVGLAERYGIYLQIVLEYHGMLRGDSWAENPYNQANGGPCKWPQDFFIDRDAKRMFKQRLRYIASRWSYSTNIFAWELFNEVDLTTHYDTADVVRWHAEMGAYLKSIDAQRHLVTTSCYNETFADDLWKQWPIDFAQAHRYTPEVIRFVRDTAANKENLKKPYFIGEFGRGWTADVDQKDTEGAHLHGGLWGSFMTPAAGAAMVWWWDTYVAPQGLYRHFRALAAFAKGEERRGRDYQFVRLQAEAPGHKHVDVRGLISSTRCLLWLFDERDASTPSATGVPRVPNGTKLRLCAMWPGDYVIEFWDTYAVKEPQRTEAHCADGTLVVTFPQADKDIACKVIFRGATSPEVKSVPPTE